MNHKEIFNKFGKFNLTPERELEGQLRVAGQETLLYLRDDKDFDPFSLVENCITGTLHDLTKITLFDCAPFAHETSQRNGEEFYSSRIFPNFVLEGDCHIAPGDKVISQVSFVIDGVFVLFYDFDAFGHVINSTQYIEEIVQANLVGRQIPVGPDPQIVYFTGKRNIITVDTAWGIFRAQHNPSFNFPDPEGVRIDNVISLTLDLKELATFRETIERMLRLVRFFGLLIGRPQNIREIRIFLNDKNLKPLKVHWSYIPSRKIEPVHTERRPNPAEVLISPISQADEFSRIMQWWVTTDKDRQNARNQFESSFAHQQNYSIDRIVSTANTFDILPASAVPSKVSISDDLKQAKQDCQKLFKELPNSYERDSVLNALGRIGKPSLKHKIGHRAKIVMDALGDRFSELILVSDASVNCRNFYVHGTRSKIDYANNFEIVCFFTDALEFIFGASELIEAGWDIQSFIRKGTSFAHPYGAFCYSYKNKLQELKSLL